MELLCAFVGGVCAPLKSLQTVHSIFTVGCRLVFSGFGVIVSCCCFQLLCARRGWYALLVYSGPRFSDSGLRR